MAASSTAREGAKLASRDHAVLWSRRAVDLCRVAACLCQS
jgi:hypothetical protein